MALLRTVAERQWNRDQFGSALFSHDATHWRSSRWWIKSVVFSDSLPSDQDSSGQILWCQRAILINSIKSTLSRSIRSGMNVNIWQLVVDQNEHWRRELDPALMEISSSSTRRERSRRSDGSQVTIVSQVFHSVDESSQWLWRWSERRTRSNLSQSQQTQFLTQLPQKQQSVRNSTLVPMSNLLAANSETRRFFNKEQTFDRSAGIVLVDRSIKDEGEFLIIMALDNVVSPLLLISSICSYRSSFVGTQSFVCSQKTCFIWVVEQCFAPYSLQALPRNATRIDTRLEDSSKDANHLIVTKELHMPCFNGSLLFQADFTDTSNDNCPSWERERIHELSPSNSLLDHIFQLNEFIDIDQQKKISRSVPQAIQVTPPSEKTNFLGHSALLEDAPDASFDRRSISRWWQPIDLDQWQWNRSIVVHCHSKALRTRSTRLHSDS